MAISDAIDVAAPGDFTGYDPQSCDDADEFSPYADPGPHTGHEIDW